MLHRFSGDTEPCENLVEAGKGATLLIHEATMADDQAEMAAQKTHSTFAQAIDIGTRCEMKAIHAYHNANVLSSMNARNILLTHFSQRYPKVAVVSAAPADSTTFSGPRPTIATAFDYASLRIGDLWKMEKYMPAIVQCYDDADEDEAGETP